MESPWRPCEDHGDPPDQPDIGRRASVAHLGWCLPRQPCAQVPPDPSRSTVKPQVSACSSGSFVILQVLILASQAINSAEVANDEARRAGQAEPGDCPAC